ncbi:UNVERIFIED_CONTAM: hypothetical protein HDU68_008517 [Siphonaria sp. JEL0065]|nr:hypothetical protein HDU68_008517 [Siphonaria sp. JEL0065]
MTVQTQVSLDGVPMRAGDFVNGELANRVNVQNRNEALLKAWAEKAHGKRQSTLIFAADVQHIQDLVALFTKSGHQAYGIHGKTPKTKRSEILNGFKEGAFPILINCGILTEGVDITRIDCIVLARPTRSGVLLQQMIGRGLRRYEDKETGFVKKDCLMIDFADTCADSEFGIHATMPTLMGLRPDFKIGDGENIAELAEQISGFLKIHPDIAKKAKSIEDVESMALEMQMKKQEQMANECELSMSFQEFSLSDLYDPDYVSRDDTPLHAVSPLAWVRVGKYECVLSMTAKEAVLVQKDEDSGQFYAIHRKKRSAGKSVWWDSTVILTHDSLTSAIRASDSWISVKDPFLAVKMLPRNSFWRRKPASDAQLKLLSGKGFVVKPGKGLQCGTAADMITRFVFGGKGKAAAFGVEKRKAERGEMKKAKGAAGNVFEVPKVVGV